MQICCKHALTIWLGLSLVPAGLGAEPKPGSPLRSSRSTPVWDNLSDTWVATDGLGRSLPDVGEVGQPRTNRTVGIFYFGWLGAHGKKLHDISRILAANPTHPQFGPVHDFHFWGEPLFGYYLSDDEWVIRKHTQMLTDAGVDVLILDVTNGTVYEKEYREICAVWEKMRREGQRTPQFAFIAHFDEGAVVQRLYDNFYSKGEHSDLWFKWDGKPLVLAAPAALTPALRDFFTVRKSWAWTQGHEWFADGRDKWPWLDFYPQNFGWHVDPKVPEQISVNVAQHANSNIGRSFNDGKQPPAGQTDSKAGLCFAEQWRQALKVDPEFVFITGWNEWVAQRFVSEAGGQTFLGQVLPPGGTFFVDQYNQEFSRDIEPMSPNQPGSFGDNYYYQMAANIRRYKGVRPTPLVQPQPILIGGSFDDWKAVKPEFRDTIGDTAHRQHPGWIGSGPYVNNTGRNDLIAAKVSADATNVYFYVRTAEPLTPPSTNWMMLFIDADGNHTNGWLGYDLVVNRVGIAVTNGLGTTTVEINLGSYAWGSPVTVPLHYAGNEVEVAIPRSVLGTNTIFDFKWTDNILQAGNWSDLTLNGDAAPNDRFNYRAIMIAPFKSMTPPSH